MITLSGTIEYEGGRTETFETGAAALAEWELFAMRHGYPLGEAAPPMLSALVIAHHALGVAEGFDVWRRSVTNVELESANVDPIPRAPTAA